MLKWLIKKWSREGAEEALRKLNFHLSSSFLNVKKDMDALSRDINKNDDKFKYFEQRMSFLESQFLTLFSQMQQNNPQKEKKTKELPSPEISPITINTEMVFSELTYTQKSLLLAIYDHQQAINAPLSTKSIAKIFYKERDYNSVRTTITEYLDILASHGLIKKTRKKRQNYSYVTERGVQLIEKSLRKKNKGKETIDDAY